MWTGISPKTIAEYLISIWIVISRTFYGWSEGVPNTGYVMVKYFNMFFSLHVGMVQKRRLYCTLKLVKSRFQMFQNLNGIIPVLREGDFAFCTLRFKTGVVVILTQI